MTYDTNVINFSEEDKLYSGRELGQIYARIKDEKGEDAANLFLQNQEELRKRLEKESGVRQSPIFPPSGNGEDSSSIGAIPDINSGTGKLADNIEKTIKSSPVDQTRLPAVKPESIQDTVNILQPKSIVFGQYQLSEIQEDVMTHIMEQLQDYMSKSLSAVSPDIFGEIKIRLDCNSICDNNKALVIDNIENMLHYQFSFWWQNNLVPKGTTAVQTKGVIISTYHNYIGTSYVDIVINKWATPFLLYYGKGIGGNFFDKKKALVITGKYSKRLYKTLAGYVDKGVFDYKITNFLKDYMIPKSYTNGDLKRRVIMPAVKAINDVNPGFFVEAEFLTLGDKNDTRKKKSRKQPFDTIRFTITKTGVQDESKENTASDTQKEAKIISVLSPLLEEPFKGRILTYIRTWQNHGDFNFVYSKVVYYSDLLAKGSIAPQKMKNFLLKAIEEETHIKLRVSRKKQVGIEPDGI